MSCNCIGDWCTCTPGKRVAKDGTTVHVPTMMKDSAMTENGPQLTADALPTATMTLDEAMALPRYQGMWPSQRQQYVARDLAMAKAGKLADADYQQGVRDAYAERVSNAWRSGDNDNAPAKIGDAAQAHDQLRHDLSEAWKH